MISADAKPEFWVYGGKRLSKRDTLLDVWLPPLDDGSYQPESIAAYTKFGSNCIVGGLYEVKVERDHQSMQIYGEPAWKQRYPNRELTQQLHNADNEARQKHATIRHHKNEAKVDAHDAAMVPLLEFAKNCRTGAERDALIATTIRKLSQVWI